MLSLERQLCTSERKKTKHIRKYESKDYSLLSIVSSTISICDIRAQPLYALLDKGNFQNRTVDLWHDMQVSIFVDFFDQTIYKL